MKVRQAAVAAILGILVSACDPATLAALSGGTGGGSGTTPTPKPKPSSSNPVTSDDYFPFIEGGNWQYQEENGALIVATMSIAMSLVTTQGDVTTANIRMGLHDVASGRDGVQDVIYKRSLTQIQELDPDGTAKTLVGLPIAIGTTWNVGSDTFNIVATEDVSVAAGVFRGCLRVEDNDSLKESDWFAPGVGRVKWKFSSDGTPDQVYELTKFSKT